MEEDNRNRYKVKLDSKSTQEVTHTYNITWTIPRFEELLNTIVSGLCTPGYTVVNVQDTPFQLKVGISVMNTQMAVEIDYLIDTSSFVRLSMDVKCGCGSFSKAFSNEQTVQGNEWKRGAVLNDPKQLLSRCSISETLKLYFCFTVSQVVHNVPAPAPRLSEDFGTLLNDASFSDVTMKSAEGIEFRAHKSVLAARSKVLRAHFEHNTKESITNVVETSWESEVLRDVLTFIYTDKAPRVDDAPDKLLAAADYYQLDRLKSLCEEALHKRLSVENAVYTLQLAELHSSNSLMQSTLAFIKNGRTELVTKTEGWTSIQSVGILKRMYEFITAGETINFEKDVLAAALTKIN
ncbi:Roadkill [Operophtera brumata]|uniref:Roadkill n=1 Tax=Operophtera brumata TaxID=104452 RepID=A0A0L7KZG9_OPEBR|nr:Roadkill [Operophtera brumata]